MKEQEIRELQTEVQDLRTSLQPRALQMRVSPDSALSHLLQCLCLGIWCCAALATRLKQHPRRGSLLDFQLPRETPRGRVSRWSVGAS